MEHQNIFKLPIKRDDCSVYIYTSDNKILFNILIDDDVLIDSIIQKINGEINIKFNAKYENQRIYINNQPTLLIRSFGYLTGIGGLHLPPQKACEIQDEFCKFCVNQLNK